MSESHCTITGLTAEQADWFWSVFGDRNPDACWLWPRSCAYRGYGQVMFNSRRFNTHRLAWMLANGRPIPARMHVCHNCDTPRCCNPAHLRVATAAENHGESVAKGRRIRGERHPGSRLNATAVRYIRCLREAGETITALAEGFGVEQTTICQVIHRITWRHVE